LEALEERTLLSAPVSTTGGLVDAINSANSSGTPTTITLQPGAAFDFTTGFLAFHYGWSAVPLITGKITIVGNNDAIERSTATGTSPFRLFSVAPGGSLTLENLTLQGGSAFEPGLPATEGGAVYSSGTLNLGGVTVKTTRLRAASELVVCKESETAFRAGPVWAAACTWPEAASA
jgi:hypothetical protein